MQVQHQLAINLVLPSPASQLMPPHIFASAVSALAVHVRSCRLALDAAHQASSQFCLVVGRYVTESKRISFKDETKLGLMTSEEEAAAVERRASSAAAGPRPPDFHFICEVCRDVHSVAPAQYSFVACAPKPRTKYGSEQTDRHPSTRRDMAVLAPPEDHSIGMAVFSSCRRRARPEAWRHLCRHSS
jgi:hypothetical protein